MRLRDDIPSALPHDAGTARAPGERIERSDPPNGGGDHAKRHEACDESWEPRINWRPSRTLSFVDGVPSAEIGESVYEHLDFVHGLKLISTASVGRRRTHSEEGFHDVGVEATTSSSSPELMGRSLTEMACVPGPECMSLRLR
jgi:hypothetical protein